MNKHTIRTNERFLMIVAVAGLAIMLLLGWVAYANADIDSGGANTGSSLSESYVVYELGTGITGTLTDFASFGSSMNLNGNMYLYRHNSQWTSGAVYDGAGTTYYSLNGGTTYGDRYEVNGLSVVADPTKWYYLAYIPVNTGAQFTGWSSDQYVGYGWHNYGDYTTSYTSMGGIYDPKFTITGWDSPVFPAPVVDPTVEMTNPAYSQSMAGNSIDFEFHIETVEAGSYSLQMLFERQGIQNMFIPFIWGLSSAGPDTYDVEYTVDNLDQGTYTNFLIQLKKGTEIVASTSSAIEIGISGVDIGGFEDQTYYLGSSTTYYADHLPDIFVDNGLATASAFYTEITGYVDGVLNKIYGIAGGFSSFFSSENAISYGQTVSTQAVLIWGYVNDADDLFGGYPFSVTIFLFFVLMIAMLVIKFIKSILLR